MWREGSDLQIGCAICDGDGDGLDVVGLVRFEHRIAAVDDDDQVIWPRHVGRELEGGGARFRLPRQENTGAHHLAQRDVGGVKRGIRREIDAICPGIHRRGNLTCIGLCIGDRERFPFNRRSTDRATAHHKIRGCLGHGQLNR